MRAYAPALLAMGCMVGCASQSGMNSGKVTAQEQTPTELAAYAGHATYPTTLPASQDLRAAAIVGPGKKYIKIYNFSTEPVRDADIWVNGAFVQHIDGIAAAVEHNHPKRSDVQRDGKELFKPGRAREQGAAPQRGWVVHHARPSGRVGEGSDEW